jgi:hypothetical protein
MVSLAGSAYTSPERVARAGPATHEQIRVLSDEGHPALEDEAALLRSNNRLTVG